MDFSNDQLTFLVAAYAAVVSTVLGVWEFIKEKRKIVIFLVENNGQQYSITITNIGHRPITLMNLHMNIPTIGLKPLNSLLWFKDDEDEVKSPLPVTLTDGENISLLKCH